MKNNLPQHNATTLYCGRRPQHFENKTLPICELIIFLSFNVSKSPITLHTGHKCEFMTNIKKGEDLKLAVLGIKISHFDT